MVGSAQHEVLKGRSSREVEKHSSKPTEDTFTSDPCILHDNTGSAQTICALQKEKAQGT